VLAGHILAEINLAQQLTLEEMHGWSPKELKEGVSCCLFRCERERWKTEIIN